METNYHAGDLSRLMTVDANVPAPVALQKMLMHNVLHLPVIQEQGIVGVISRYDLQKPTFGTSRVRDLMHVPVHTIDWNADMSEVIQKMKTVAPVLLVVRDGNPQGLIGAEDLCEILLRQLEDTDQVSSDAVERLAFQARVGEIFTTLSNYGI